MTYDFIFVVVNYRTVDDLISFIVSCENIPNSYKIIVVNNHYNNLTDNLVLTICNNYNCDYVGTENKGYSCSNNLGISIAKDKYHFNYLVVSNPDVMITKLSIKSLSKYSTTNSIIGPKIMTPNNKNQNPFYRKRNKIIEKVTYLSFKKNLKILLYLALSLSKVIKLTQNFKTVKKVFALHGSFLIFGRKVLDLMNPIFDENMFLFSEENVLAIRAQRLGINLFHEDEVVVFHKQDSSMKFLKDENKILAKSYIYYYENYIIKGV